MNTRKKIIVIGGGAIGLSTAYYLNKSGHEVTVLDNSPKISNCSFGNAGMVVPSHFIPLAAPGVVWQGLKWLFNPESPFSIKPSLDIQLLSWLFHFYKASKAKHVKQTMTLLYQLNKASSELFKELNKELDFDYESKGLVILANSKKGLKHELVNLTLAKSLGQPVDLLTISDVRDLLGQDQLTIEGGVHYKEDGHLNPITYMSNLEKHLNHNGVNFHKSTEILEITSDKSTITGITTSTGNFSADEYVLSAGAWSAKLVKELGVNLHLAPGKGYSFTLNNPQKPILLPTILAEGKVAITPLKIRYALQEPWRFGGFDLGVNKNRVNGLIKSIHNYFPAYNPEDFNGINAWSGLRPVSFDGLPFIGRFKKYPNLIAATGHSMMGISLAPITGKIVEEIIAKRKIDYNMDLLSPGRN